MKNFPVKHTDGNTYWISRAISVAAFVFAKVGGKLYILANKRGAGVDECRGYWNCPCGFLDYDETTREAASREVFEETGLQLSSKKYKLFYINDKPSNAENQTVTFRFYVDLGKVTELPPLTMENMEKNEVDELQWIDVTDLNKYKWAFNHNQIIKELVVENGLL